MKMMKIKRFMTACVICSTLLANSSTIAHVYYKRGISVYSKASCYVYRQPQPYLYHHLPPKNNKHACCGGASCPTKHDIFCNVGDNEFEPLCCHHSTSYCLR